MLMTMLKQTTLYHTIRQVKQLSMYITNKSNTTLIEVKVVIVQTIITLARFNYITSHTGVTNNINSGFNNVGMLLLGCKCWEFFVQPAVFSLLSHLNGTK